MVCLSAMQGLGKPGVNMGNLQWGTPVDFQFYFPGYSEGGMSGDLEGTALPISLYQRMPQLPTMNSAFQRIPRLSTPEAITVRKFEPEASCDFAVTLPATAEAVRFAPSSR